jgi:hypothetical protein
MSGYLKRMAASVAHPAGAVHPLVTNVFAKGVRPEAGPETGEVEMLTESQRPLGRSVGLQAQVLRERALFSNSDADASDSRRMDSEADASRQDGAISSREQLVPGWKQAAMEGRSEVHRVREDRRQFSSDAPGSVERGAEVEARKFVPIVKRVDEATREDATTSVAAEYSQVTARAGGTDVRRETAAQRHAKSNEAQRGGDEIQIHIGRIEVIAVPQQAQRPAPARTQHGETLEAYLKRHDRRSR